MIIVATKEQVIKMAKLAIMASVPVGMGFLHHRPDLKEEEIQLEEPSVDYFCGRMVKFWARDNKDGSWDFADTIRDDYQSWINIYPSYQALFEEVVRRG